MRREEHRAGDDQRVLVFLAELLPERDVGEDALVRLEILLVADLDFGVGCAAWPAARLGAGVVRAGSRDRRQLLAVGGVRLATGCVACRCDRRLCRRLLVGDLGERQHVGFDHAQRRLRAQLAAQQPHRLEVRVHVLGAAGDEAGDEHALERRHVHLRLDRRLDRDLVEVRAGRRRAQHEQPSEASDRCGVSCGH